MSFKDKVAENKMVAKKCLELKAYNAGVTRAYYSAFLHIKDYLLRKNFNYENFLRSKGLKEREYSHGSIQMAVVTCLQTNGNKPSDIFKLNIIDNMYRKRRRADYEKDSIIEVELKSSLDELDTVLSIVA